jgi:hypothetical protein
MYRQSDCQQHVILLDVLSKYEPEAFAYESWNTPEVQAYTSMMMMTSTTTSSSTSTTWSHGSLKTLLRFASNTFGGAKTNSKKQNTLALKAN